MATEQARLAGRPNPAEPVAFPPGGRWPEGHEHHAASPTGSANRVRRAAAGVALIGGVPLAALAVGVPVSTALLLGVLMLCMGSHLLMGHGSRGGGGDPHANH